MKKTTLLLASLALASSAFAQQFSFEPVDNRLVALDPNAALMPSSSTQNTPIVKYNFDEEVTGDIILDPPGYETQYSKEAFYYYLLGGVQMNNYVAGLVSHIREDGGDVYLHDPFSAFQMDGYLKGSRDGFEVTFKFPQLIYTQEMNGVLRKFYANKMDKVFVTDENGRKKFTYEVSDDNSLTFTIDDDGNYRMPSANITDTNYPDFILGLTDADGKFMGYGDADIILMPSPNEALTELPEGLEAEYWALTANARSRWVKVAVSDTDIYIGNLHDDMKDSFIKGTLKDGVASFPEKQYLGLYQSLFTYFMPCHKTIEHNPSTDSDINVYNRLEVLELAYDPEKKTLSNDKESYVVITGDNRILAVYDFPYLHWQQPGVTYDKPATPVVGKQYDYDEDYGYGAMWFNIPAWDINKNLYDTENLYYIIYTEKDIPFELYQDEYKTIPWESILEIPYDYMNTDCIFVNGNIHTWVYYVTGVEEFGVRSVYYQGDQRLVSDYAGYNFLQSSVKDNASEQLTVSKEYFDLQGRRIANPDRGIVIERAVMSDGSVRSRKIVK